MFRRVRWDRLGASDLSKHRDCATTPTSLSADTASSPHRSEAVVVAVRHVACAAWAKAATLLSLQCVTLRGPEPRPEGLGHLPCRVPGAPETAADRSTLSAAEGNKRSLLAAGPKAIPRPEGAHRPSCTCRGLSWPHSLPSQPFHSLFDSFQSAYHLSLLVLVHYWSCASISLRWRLPPTLGCNPKQLDSPKRSRVPQSVAPTYRAITLSGMSFLSNFGRMLWGWPFSRLQFADAMHRRLQAWAVPTSLTVTGGLLVCFLS